MAGVDSRIVVEVAYALPNRQRLIALEVERGTTALAAVVLSGIAREFPEIDPERADMGIFAKNLDGKTLPLPSVYQLKAQDRVEIYRPLMADPKAARAQRAATVKQGKIRQGHAQG
jgi:putative ubiquitin-RnfH superfamily antitoxin RatB of RatAB toxin-antitoxin module